MDLKKVRKISIIIYSVFAVLMLLMIITLKAPFGLAAVGVLIAYALFVSAFWRCPKCGKALGYLWAKHCSDCGEKIL